MGDLVTKIYRNLVLSVLVALNISAYGQSEPITLIQKVVDKIESNTTLTVKEVDATEVYNRAFDGGGIIKIFTDQKVLVKIEEEIGLSFGRLTTIIYFENGEPIKIIDREENYKWREDQSGWDYTELNQVFQADIYIFDWEMDNNQTVKKGERNLSEGTCAIFEYEPLIELSRELVQK